MPLLSLAAKHAYLLHLRSDEWYLNKIKEEYRDPGKKGYAREDVGEYICKVLRGYAEADFELLGKNLPGALNKIQPLASRMTLTLHLMANIHCTAGGCLLFHCFVYLVHCVVFHHSVAGRE